MKNRLAPSTVLALLAAFSAIAATVVGCASSSGLVAPGSSDVAPSAESRPLGVQPASSTQWPHLRALDPQNLESRGFTRMEATPVASKGHHPPGWKGIVHVDNDGAPLYRALRPGVVLPEGTVLAEAHVVESGAPGPIFAMAKTNGAWTYSIVAPVGHIEEQGDIPTCARCHGESPHDAVFGPRVPAFGRCITTRRELQAIAKRPGNFSCYVVEVCPSCSWNHLARTFLLSPVRGKAAVL